jgi:lipopolysaccharide transport system permease protein
MSETEPEKPNEQWDLVIEPNTTWVNLNLREIYRYRDLIYLMIKRDFTTIYKQTILGPLWYIVQPLVTTVMWGFVFGNLAKIPTDGIPQTLFYFSGTMLWGYFNTCMGTASDTFASNSNLFGKIYFPRLVMPISKVFSNMISLVIQFVTMMVIQVNLILHGVAVYPTLWALMMPLVILWLAAFGTGFGMIVSSLTTKYRDLRQVIAFAMSLWMYATPIVYPFSRVPEHYKWAFYINPVSAPIEFFRFAFFGAGYVNPLFLLTSIAITALLLVVGLSLFTHNERTFIDVA